MKKILYLLLSAVCLMYACSSEEENLKAGTSSIKLEQYAATKIVAVKSNVDWTASSSESWCTFVGPQSGSGNGYITISMPKNMGEERVATVTVTSGPQTVSFTVTQAKYEPTLALSTSSLSYDKTGRNISFGISSDIDWTISSDQPWCAVSTTAGSKNASIAVTLQANPNATVRTATITVVGDTMTRTLSIKQEGLPNLSGYYTVEYLAGNQYGANPETAHSRKVNKVADDTYECFLGYWQENPFTITINADFTCTISSGYIDAENPNNPSASSTVSSYDPETGVFYIQFAATWPGWFVEEKLSNKRATP